MANAKKKKVIPRGRKGGRKLTLNNELIKKMGDLFKLGCTNKAVYNGVCLSSTQFQFWKDKGEEALKKREEEGIESLTENEVLYASFRETIDKALADFQAEALKTVKTASLKSWQAGCWLLERRFQEQFAIRKNIDVQHAGKMKIEFEDVKSRAKEIVKEAKEADKVEAKQS